MPFNPFDVPIGNKLSADDLKKLLERNVAEGYQVEYKSAFPANDKIGRSIASFANTYGGWYFVGVEADKFNNVPTNICGFSLTTFNDPIAKVRDVIKYHVDPMPTIFPQVVMLDSASAVLVVHIPSEQETPFIASDGRIYRRNADSSDPVSEKDRYTIDRLVDNGRNLVKRFEDFCEDERAFSRAESKKGWVNIFLSPLPLDLTEQTETYSTVGIERLLEQSRQPTTIQLLRPGHTLSASLPFDIAQPTHQSVILRQVMPTRAASNSLTVELFADGRAKLHIPIDFMSVWGNLDALESARTRQVLSELYGTDEDTDLYLLRFIDFSSLWLAIAHLVSYYQAWLQRRLGEEIRALDIKAAATITGVWRSVPFFDSDEWGEHVAKFGLPVVGSDLVRLPADIGRGLVVTGEAAPAWLLLGSYISLALGLPIDLASTAVARALQQAIDRGSGSEPDS